jgi:hypothetical protein
MVEPGAARRRDAIGGEDAMMRVPATGLKGAG